MRTATARIETVKMAGLFFGFSRRGNRAHRRCRGCLGRARGSGVRGLRRAAENRRLRLPHRSPSARRPDRTRGSCPGFAGLRRRARRQFSRAGRGGTVTGCAPTLLEPTLSCRSAPRRHAIALGRILERQAMAVRKVVSMRSRGSCREASAGSAGTCVWPVRIVWPFCIRAPSGKLVDHAAIDAGMDTRPPLRQAISASRRACVRSPSPASAPAWRGRRHCRGRTRGSPCRPHR